MDLPFGMLEKCRTGAREKRGRPYTPSKKGEGLLGRRFFFAGAPWGGGGRGVILRVTVDVGMLLMDGGRSVRGGGGACVMMFGRAGRAQCLICGPTRLEEEEDMIILKNNKKI